MEFKRKQIIDEKGHLRNVNVWSIEVDYTNINDLLLLQNKVNSQLASIRAEINGNAKDQKLKRFDACNAIYGTDISDLYSDLDLDTLPIYYVYAHCEPLNIAVGKNGVTTWASTIGFKNRPFYIGKGTGERAFNLSRNETHRKVKQRIVAFGKEPVVNIIKDGLTELEALCLESKLIDIFGILGKGGKLVNLDEGIKYKERQLRYSAHLCEVNSFYKNSLVLEQRKL